MHISFGNNATHQYKGEVICITLHCFLGSGIWGFCNSQSATEFLTVYRAMLKNISSLWVTFCNSDIPVVCGTTLCCTFLYYFLRLVSFTCLSTLL